MSCHFCPEVGRHLQILHVWTAGWTLHCWIRGHPAKVPAAWHWRACPSIFQPLTSSDGWALAQTLFSYWQFSICYFQAGGNGWCSLLEGIFMPATAHDWLSQLRGFGIFCSALSVIPPQSDLESQGVLLQIGRLRRFLYDLCIWAPLSSDIVECYHGFTQCQLHRWRGSKVTDPVAQERTVWYSICSAYGVFKKWVHAQFLDKWFWMRLACFGRKTSNQYTVREDGKRVAKGTCASKPSFTVCKMDRLLALEKDLPRLRKLCGDLSEISAAAHSIVGWLW